MSIHDQYAEQVIAARDHDLAEAHRRIGQLERLVRDMRDALIGYRCWLCDEQPGKAEWIDFDERMEELGIDHARATIDTLRARYGKGKTKLTDEQIAEGLEHYRPKAEVDIVVIDELRGDVK